MAVKRLSRGATLTSEIRAIKDKLIHENVIRYHTTETNEELGHDYIVMWVPHPSL